MEVQKMGLTDRAVGCQRSILCNKNAFHQTNKQRKKKTKTRKFKKGNIAKAKRQKMKRKTCCQVRQGNFTFNIGLYSLTIT